MNTVTTTAATKISSCALSGWKVSILLISTVDDSNSVLPKGYVYACRSIMIPSFDCYSRKFFRINVNAFVEWEMNEGVSGEAGEEGEVDDDLKVEHITAETFPLLP